MASTEQKRWSCCTSPFFTIELIFFLFKIGDSMLDPSVRLFIYQGICFEQYNNDTSCYNLRDYPDRENYVQEKSAMYIMYYKLLLNVPAVFLGLFCGAWSDRVGRKLPVLLAPCGTILAVMCFMLSIIVEGNGPFLPLVLVGGAVRGCFGKSAVMTMALHSYVSDTSETDDRTTRLGKLLAMNFFGYFVGSLTAGALLKVSSFDVVFCTVVFTNCLCVIISVIFMQESIPFAPKESTNQENDDNELDLPSDVPSVSRKKSLFHWTNISESLNVLVREREGKGRFYLLIFFFTIIAQQICKSGETDTTMLFVERYPLAWDRSWYGYLLAVDYASLGIAVYLLLPLLLKCFKLNDLTLVLIGLFFKVVRLMILAFSTHTWMVYLSVTLGCPSAMIISGAKSLISKSVKENELGKTFSLLSSGETVSNLLGTVIFTNMYAATFRVFGGLTFTVDAVFHGMLFLGLLGVIRDLKTTPEISQGFLEHDGNFYGSTTTEQAPTKSLHESKSKLLECEAVAADDVVSYGTQETNLSKASID